MGKWVCDHCYDDIIACKPPVSLQHAPMSPSARAAQFAPFAALSGYGDAVAEAARLTGRRAELSEDEQLVLQNKLCLLAAKAAGHPKTEVIWFRADERKEGGSYISTIGEVRRVSEDMVILTDGTRIPLALIDDLRGEIFRIMEE